jgi:tetratricopeptide (TPR) repeat protein
MKNRNDRGASRLKKTSFQRLLREDRDLASLRQEYALKSPRERRAAADWHYHSAIAEEMFESALTKIWNQDAEVQSWPAGVVALAIDPGYAPALLTVGSIEYLYGRVEEAMTLFMKLTTLPKEEDDLPDIVDKAGDFLIDHEEYELALDLYLAAERLDSMETIYLLGSGYCLGKLGRFDEAVGKHRRVVAREPDNYKHLNDLGYSLLEAGEFDEAEQTLKRSISLAPSDYEFPTNNLELLYERKRLIGEC